MRGLGVLPRRNGLGVALIRISDLVVVRHLIAFARGHAAITATLAFVLTAAGAGFLAWYTKARATDPLTFGQLALIGSILVLSVGFVLGAVSLVAQRDRMDVAQPPTAIGLWRLLRIALLVVAASGAALGQMGALLYGFHLPGEASFGPSAVQGVGDPSQRGVHIDEALETWSRYARPGKHVGEDLPFEEKAFEGDRNAPLTVIAWFFGIDSGAFVPGYFALLGILLILAIRTLRTRASNIRKSSPNANRTIGAFRRLARRSIGLLILGAAADQLENWTALTSTTSAWFELTTAKEMTVEDTAAGFLGWATIVKWFALGFVLLNLVCIGFLFVRHGADSRKSWSGVRSAWQTFLTVRMQVIAVVLFVVVMSLPFQVADTFRRWTDDWPVAAVATICVLALAGGVWQSGRWLVRLESEISRTRDRMRVWLLTIATIVALIAFAHLAGGMRPEALVGPAAILVVFVLFRWISSDVPVKYPILPGSWAPVLPRTLAAVVVAFFGLAIVRASFGTLVYEWMQKRLTWELPVLVIWGLVLMGCSLCALLLPRVPAVSTKRLRRHRDWFPIAVLLACVTVWMIAVLVLDHLVFEVAPFVGTAGVLATFVLLLVYTLSSVVAVANSAMTAPPAIFRAAGLRRTPVLSVLVVWILIASLAPFDYPFHDVLPETEGERPFRPVLLATAFDDWVRDNCLRDPHMVSRPDPMHAVPLVLVSSSGGGVRAAVWTSFVMDKTFGYHENREGCPIYRKAWEGRSRSLFALSGISGGGLGFVEYVAQTLRSKPPLGTARARLQEHLGDDSLAPTLAWMLFMESAWSLLRFEADRDRGDILEESWRRQWEDDGRPLDENFLDLRIPESPLLLLNGASAETGCRFNGSVLDANGRGRDDIVSGCLETAGLEGATGAVLPSTIDLVDFLCEGEHTITLAAAALFTARFPGVSPVGELEQCPTGNAQVDREQLPETFIVDGGYLEGSGTATIVDLWQALAPLIVRHNRDPQATRCIVPFFVQIDNSYLEPTAPGDISAPPEVLGLQEATANRRNRNGYTTASRQAAQTAFRQPFSLGGVTIRKQGFLVRDRFAFFSLRARPGVEAPLGWTLSSASFQDLFTQFERNAKSSEKVDGWYQTMTCKVPAGS